MTTVVYFLRLAGPHQPHQSGDHAGKYELKGIGRKAFFNQSGLADHMILDMLVHPLSSPQSASDSSSFHISFVELWSLTVWKE